jgi:hypothetical protein
MFEIGARLFARGAVGALVAGFINLAAVVLADPSSQSPISWWKVTSIAWGSPILGLWFAPLTMFVLPLTWLAFRRSRYRYVALLGTGPLGGVVWSIGLFGGELPLYPLVAAGVLGGLGAASCFLGLQAPLTPA